MLKYLIQGIYQGLQVAFTGDPRPITHGFTPDQDSYEHIRFAQSVSDPGEYNSCDRHQRFSFILDCFSLSEITAIDTITTAVNWFEGQGVMMEQGEFIQFWKGSETIEEDPDRAENASIIWKASCVLIFEIATTRG